MIRFYNRAVREMVLAGMPPLWLYRHRRRKRIEQVIKATPPWVKRADFNLLHMERQLASHVTGEPYTLDHIIPLCHPMVSGLNVPWNIQVIPERINAIKGNKWQPDQIELDLSIASVSCVEPPLGEGHETR